jgi:hypothetical protein
MARNRRNNLLKSLQTMFSDRMCFVIIVIITMIIIILLKHSFFHVYIARNLNYEIF